jgi:deoxyribonuclease-4
MVVAVMMRIGAHMSVSGGVSRAVDRAVLHGCESLQIFSKNASQWNAKPLDPAEIARFRTAVEVSGIHPVISHASYLINLASMMPGLRAQSIAALVDELDRASQLGLDGVVLHPGTCTAGSQDDSLVLVAEAIRAAFAASPGTPRLLLEHTAGQGRTIGYTFEHLAAIIGHLDADPRVGVCLDTCHLVASGYDIVSEAGFAATFEAFDRLIGFDRLKAIHSNDSKKPCGSRVDRHEHIGDGCIGVEPFRRILRDPRFDGLPMLIETAKSAGAENPRTIVLDPFDVRNLETLRRLRG